MRAWSSKAPWRGAATGRRGGRRAPAASKESAAAKAEAKAAEAAGEGAAGEGAAACEPLARTLFAVQDERVLLPGFERTLVVSDPRMAGPLLEAHRAAKEKGARFEVGLFVEHPRHWEALERWVDNLPLGKSGGSEVGKLVTRDLAALKRGYGMGAGDKGKATEAEQVTATAFERLRDGRSPGGFFPVGTVAEVLEIESNLDRLEGAEDQRAADPLLLRVTLKGLRRAQVVRPVDESDDDARKLTKAAQMYSVTSEALRNAMMVDREATAAMLLSNLQEMLGMDEEGAEGEGDTHASWPVRSLNSPGEAHGDEDAAALDTEGSGSGSDEELSGEESDEDMNEDEVSHARLLKAFIHDFRNHIINNTHLQINGNLVPLSFVVQQHGIERGGVPGGIDGFPAMFSFPMSSSVQSGAHAEQAVRLKAAHLAVKGRTVVGRTMAEPTIHPARVEVTDFQCHDDCDPEDAEIQQLMRKAVGKLTQLLRVSESHRGAMNAVTAEMDAKELHRNPRLLADLVAHVCGANDRRASVNALHEVSVRSRLRGAVEALDAEVEVAKKRAAKGSDTGEVPTPLEMVMRGVGKQQMSARRGARSAGRGEESVVDKYRDRFRGFRKAVKGTPLEERINEELSRLEQLDPQGSEYSVVRTYLDWLTKVPWGKVPEDNLDIAHAQKVLAEDHYGLEEVKDRILELIAVGRLRGTVQGKIILLVGPPGVGKTSIGRSVARAVGRPYARVAVGGLDDTHELKGHRRTYVGAMPGKIVHSLASTKVMNPLILLDEIDKIGGGSFRGNPSATLMEILDPEQNSEFADTYMDVPIDLSKVLFVATANTTDTIPKPLLDRMEIIEVGAYLKEEKIEIAKAYLEPRARETSGLTEQDVRLEQGALDGLVEDYCRDAGVRSLEKAIDKIYRKVALKRVRAGGEAAAATGEAGAEAAAATGKAGVEAAAGEELAEAVAPCTAEKADGEATDEGGPAVALPTEVVRRSGLGKYLGVPVFRTDKMYDSLPVGVANGLAYTSFGGEVLLIETASFDAVGGEGKGHMHITGQLGDVMKESSSIAKRLARSGLAVLCGSGGAGSSGGGPGEWAPSASFFADSDVHLHFPAGAVPKDGPSAGIAITTALLSTALRAQCASDVAMTGEVSLTGRVLPVGGIREKIVAAKRAGMAKVILPKANERDVGELSEQVTAGVEIVYVAWYPEVLPHVFPGLEDATALAQRGNQAFVRPPSKVPRREARRPEAAA